VPTEILISSDPWENRVAILEDGQLAEIYIEREEKVIGSIYKGKVMNVLPGMGASFVDIGLGRNAFLYVDDINKTPLNIGDVEITQGRSGWTITEKISKGDDVLVQIVKEPRGQKGARISTNISLPGRYLILMPTGKYSGVSRKIESAEERNRLKGIMKLIRPEGMATVVRTAAARVSQAELIADLGVLIRMWHGILESYKRAPASSLIHKDMNLVYKAARDFITPEVEKVLIDDAEEYEKVRDFMRLLGPQYVDRIERYKNGHALFKDYRVDDEVRKLLLSKINLPSGGSIVIETTEALTVIDVNSGKFTGGKNLEDTIVKTNIEAAAEIARQVRLRDIGGIIVCDFIDMSNEAARNRVIATLEAGLRKDRTRTTIQSFSALGLLEFTRKRVGKDLAAQLRGMCPTCSGMGSVMSPESVAIDAFREIRRFGHEHLNGRGDHAPIAVIGASTVGAQIEYWYADELEKLAKELETKIEVRVDASLHPERTKILHLSQEEASAPPAVRVGDELEVDLLNVMLPVATSALAVVGDRLVEVENAGNAAGQTIKIKILDVDEDGTILAEPRAPVVVPAESKKRRRRGGAVRGRKKELTPAEQEEQLRELAEEAAKGLGGRPAIGISSTAEAEAEAEEARAHTATSPPLATVTPLHPIPDYAAVEPNGEQRAYASYGGDTEIRRRRRRRRRRGGRGPDGAALTGVSTIPGAETQSALGAETQSAPSAETPSAPLEDEEASGIGGIAAEGSTAVADDGTLRRRRRRRRRRGRGLGIEGEVTAGPSEAPPLGAVPDRHIFRVDADGTTEATGETAPPEPVRAIARVDVRKAPVALEPPPPILTVPEPPAKVAKPARRRRTKEEAAQLDLEVAPVALPAPTSADKPAATATEEQPAPKKRGRPRKVAAESATEAPVAADKPNRPRGTKRTGAAEPAAARAKKSATTKSAAAKKTTNGRKAPARKSTSTTSRKKVTTRKKRPS
jgi:ribonuclease G